MPNSATWKPYLFSGLDMGGGRRHPIQPDLPHGPTILI